ncbi:MBG domain-containing protein [Reichenbachiella ulvae]|uniref:T9SS type A sorting domain-containing protein n=1 Tax=Reichenbachiella ulvae TaxID=2980104 RepID=A0ABT3CY68_9BACT|nr:MBG domain-containing protein [Reichenbachiella ulvae]MCV9388425.1 T9SS type A sorting domain-containing protein [Reichenbachiella ulvae]
MRRFRSRSSDQNCVPRKTAFVFLLVVLFLCQNAIGQNITEVEYFFDEDPGVGSAIGMTISSSIDIDLSESLTQGLSQGFHVLSVRAKNENGYWGFAERRTFFVPSVAIAEPTPSDITAMEYYIDHDPGVGAATPITISSADAVELSNEIIDASALSAGFHSIFIRTQNADDIWGLPESRAFYVTAEAAGADPIADIAVLEYFFDEDPGVGQATGITISAGQTLEIDELIPQSLSTGYHQIYIRAQNTNGTWGLNERRTIYVKPEVIASTTSNIARLEYFINQDAGLGDGIALTLDPAAEINIENLIIDPEEDLPLGTNTFGVRAQNAEGQWGFTEIREFEVEDDCIHPVANFEIDLACEGEEVTFTDISSNLQEDASYTWYLDGAELVDESSSILSMIFENSGEYSMSLVVKQGQICKDSTGATFNIKKKPIVVFSADPVYLGEPTSYEVDTFYANPSASWVWDFDGDGHVDDQTVGNNTYTFSAIGTYTSTLSISDGVGCEASYTREIEVLEESSIILIPDVEISVFDGLDNSGTEISNHQETKIDLGEILVGETVTRSFTIENSGTDILAISSILSSDQHFSVSEVPAEVAALGMDSFSISFISTVAGLFSSSIIIENEDADESVFVINVVANVLQKPLPTLIMDLGDITYGDEDFALQASSNSTGLITYASSDESIISITDGVASVVGTGPCQITAHQASSDEFLSTKVISSIAVQKKVLFVFADPISKKYGDTNPELGLNYSGFVDGETVSNLVVPPIANTNCNELSEVGSYTINVIVGTDDHYDVVAINGELEVVKTELLVSADDLSKTYGDSNPELSITYEGFVNEEGLEVLDSAPSTETVANELSPVGAYVIEVIAGSDNNYEIVTEDAELEVRKAQLTITADDQTKMAGFDNPELTLSYAGFVNDEDETAIIPPSVHTTASLDSDEGTYEIFLTGGSGDNYELTLVNGTLTVKPSNILSADNPETTLTIYPNPCLDQFYIRGLEAKAALSIIDLQGKQVAYFDQAQEKYDIRSLKSGIYFVKIQSKNDSHSFKLVKP